MFAKKVLALSLAAALCGSTAAMAAEKSNEVSLAGSMSSDSTTAGGTTTTTDSTNIYGSFGHYFTNQLVGQLALGVMASGSSGNTTNTLIMGAGAKYYFMDANKGDTVPFAGARLDLVSVSGTGFDASGSQITGFVGVSHFVSETASLDLTFSAAAGSIEVTGGSSVDTTRTSLDIGFTQRF